MSKILLIFAAGLLLAAAAAAQAGPVEIKDAWARATPKKAENGVAYMTLVSPTTDRLIGASTPVAKKAELHQMKIEDGIMKMRPLAAIALPAGQVVALKPSAVHIMLHGLNQPLQPGQSFPLTLHFEKAGARQITVAVAKAGATGRSSQAGGEHMPMPAGH